MDKKENYLQTGKFLGTPKRDAVKQRRAGAYSLQQELQNFVQKLCDLFFLLETGLQNKGYFGLIINKEQPTMMIFYKIESYFIDLLGEKGSYHLDDKLSKQPL